MTSAAGLPAIVALVKSANIVGEWLPKMMMSSTSVRATPAFCASWACARFWSSRVIAVKRSGPRRLAWAAAIMQLVLHGLPTTTTRASSEATSSMALPWPTKILPLSFSRSARSMPGPRGLEPTRMHQSASLNATFGSPVSTMPAQEREGAVVELHRDALERLLDRLDRDLEQLQDDRLVLAEHLARGDARQDAVADLTGGAGDGDAERSLLGRAHLDTCSFSIRASATPEVPTAVGSLRSSFMSYVTDLPSRISSAMAFSMRSAASTSLR